VLSLELEGIGAEPAALDVFLAVDGGSREEALRVLGELRAAGLAADTDYAGRSVKGQLTQGARRAHAIVVVGESGMMLRRPGELDVAVDVPELKDLLR
jgi:histidyl-tRNA synthetase